MTLGDSLHYIAIGNPVSKAVIGTTTSLLRIGNSSTSKIAAAQASGCSALSSTMPQLYRLAGRNYNFIRLAGLSGAAAVIIGAIGSHRLNPTQDKGEAKAIFETANRFHFFHALALMGAPMARYPLLTGTLMLGGCSIFSGLLYYRAFTGDKTYAKYAPYAGCCLILAWLSFVI